MGSQNCFLTHCHDREHKKDYIGFFTSYNEIFRDLFRWTRSFGSICVLTLNIFHISIIMRENITLGLKFHSPFLLHSLGIGKSLKSELLELNSRVLGDSIPRKKKGKMSQNVPWILCKQLSTVWEQEEKQKHMEGPQIFMLPRMRA